MLHMPNAHLHNLRQTIERVAAPAFAGLFAALIFMAVTAWHNGHFDEFAFTTTALIVLLIGNAITMQRHEMTLHAEAEFRQRALHDQAEQLECLAQKARKGSDAKSEFLAMMSHDLRTPMNAIVGYSSLLSETRLDEEQKSFVAVIMQACGNMLGLINDILDMTRLESGKMEAREAAYSPHDLLKSVARVVQVIATSRGTEIKIHTDPQLGKRLMGDCERLNQVLLNLAGNAAKFTHKGVITISVTLENAGDALRFTVADTGKGMPEDMKSRLFQPFEQGDNGRAAGKNSTGLGLAISDRIVRLLGGEIICQSESGVGTTFYFDLPMKVAHDIVVAAPIEQIQAPDVLRDRAVLIADDTPANLMLASAILKKCGMIVTAVADGASAIHAAKTQDFDIMFIDIQMPDHSGIEVASVIRTMAGQRANTPLVALTAQSFQRDRERALASGFDAFLSKPIRAIDLETMANGLLADYPVRQIKLGSGPVKSLAVLVLVCFTTVRKIWHE